MSWAVCVQGRLPSTMSPQVRSLGQGRWPGCIAVPGSWCGESRTRRAIRPTAASTGSNAAALLSRSASLSQAMVALCRLQESPLAAQATRAPPRRFDNAADRAIPMTEPRAPRLDCASQQRAKSATIIAFLRRSGRATGPKHRRGFTDRSPLLLCPPAGARQGDHGRNGAVMAATTKSRSACAHTLSDSGCEVRRTSASPSGDGFLAPLSDFTSVEEN